MAQASMLSIVKRGHTYRLRYASSNPYDMDRAPYLCSDEGALDTLLRRWGIDTWSLQQAAATLSKGGVAVLPVMLSEAQLHVYFPAQRSRRVGTDPAVTRTARRPLPGTP